jgi:hypothetical protein
MPCDWQLFYLLSTTSFPVSIVVSIIGTIGTRFSIRSYVTTQPQKLYPVAPSETWSFPR